MADTRIGLTTQLDSLQDKILALPRAAERGGRLQRDIVRLTTIFTALQAQLVEARLAAIGEGGEVRPIDFAVPPRKPWFPAPLLTMSIGSFGGLLLGCVAALMLGWFGRWLRDPTDIERATGVAVQRFDAKAPLVLSGASTRTILVVPLGEGAQAGAVAQRLVETAVVRSMRAKVLDLSNTWSSNGSDAGNPSGLIEKLESEGGLVVVQLPSLIDNATVAALRESRAVVFVAPPGPVDRSRLSSALELLERLGVPCAGVVISDQRARGIRA